MAEVGSVGSLIVVSDMGPANWLIDSVVSLPRYVTEAVPGEYDGYIRIVHPAYREAGGELSPVSWAEVARANGKTYHPGMQFQSLVGHSKWGYSQPGLWNYIPEEGALPRRCVAALAKVLARHTTTPDECWFAIWNGWGDLASTLNVAPTFALPGRRYHLARGGVLAADQSIVNSDVFGERFQTVLDTIHPRSANLWWPEDRAWFVATEIDSDSTYVGGSRECLAQILVTPELETFSVEGSAPVTSDSDMQNPTPT